MENSVIVSTPGKGRKKIPDPSKWKATQAKSARYKPKSLPSRPQCSHKKKTFACADLTMQEIRKFHTCFYQNKTKVEQDNFILKHTSQNVPKRRRPVKGTRSNSISLSYFIKTKNGTLSICSNAFLSILAISRFRVQNLSKRFLSCGCPPKENRGGDRKSRVYVEKKQRVTNFIKKLKCVESHYTRNKSERQYMASDLSIRKLWKMYCSDNKDLEVKYDYFRDIFTSDFNISFQTPATDACSECISLKCQITAASNGETKAELMCKLRVHKLKAKSFYDLLKQSEENTIKISFDCQKNLVLPRVPDQSAYYSRQFYWYNFTICDGHSKSVQTKDTVTAYTWTENIGGKGSNEIASMVNHKLSTLNLAEATCIKLFCDGCPGQNKNSIMIGMLMHWLFFTESSVQDIHVIFPIVGHSFLPPDRVFGRAEKKVKKKEVILHPREYREILSDSATVLDLEKDYDIIFDWKKAIEGCVKPPNQWHFQFSAAKRISIKKRCQQAGKSILVKGEVNFRSDLGTYKSVLRKGKSLASIKPEPLPKVHSVKAAKIKDVDALLKKHFGLDWRNIPNEDLSFYKNIIDNDNALEQEDNANGEDVIDNIEEDDGLRI